jgi:glycosyltransferase involved in cell wall biosynthesis
MDQPADCAAVIPCFNEAARIGLVVATVRRHVGRVIVVDDGSADATADIARTAGAEVVQLPRNSGKGAALRHGWEHARKAGFQWVLMLDGDGQHAAEDIPNFFECARRTGAALIVGNRMGNAQTMPFVRRCANRWMSRWISRLTHAELPDSQCGFRLARADLLVGLALHANRFEIESAMLVAFLGAGQPVKFVPIRTIYDGRASKVNPVTDSWRWLRWRLAQPASLRAWSTMRVP